MVQEVRRRDQFVPNTDGLPLFLREVSVVDLASSAPAVLLIHGARVAGVASFDLPVAGGSLAEDLARAGLRVFVGDLRGYGRSGFPAEMDQPAELHPPLVRVRDAARDIESLVDRIREEYGLEHVSLLGWATGGMWCGYLATVAPEKIDRLILHNTIYCSPGHPTLGAGSSLEDPEHAGRFTPDIGAYRYNDGAGLLRGWDASAPDGDPDAWCDPAIKRAYVTEALAEDPTSGERDPASFRAPSGALEDSFYQCLGRQLWDASLIESPTLVIRSERDFWSQPVDCERLMSHLVHAASATAVSIPNASHWVHLERPEAGRTQFLEAIQRALCD